MKWTSICLFPSKCCLAARGLHVAVLSALCAAVGCGKGATAPASLPVAALPSFSPAGGTYSTSQMVAITDTSPGVTIHYTTDGSTPTSASPTYSGPITVAAAEMIEAYAAEIGYTASAVATASYTFTNLPVAATPSIWVAGGANSSEQTVTMTNTSTGATIYYTVDGSTPTTSSAVYATPVIVRATETIKAIAGGAAYKTSTAASTAVTIVAAPWDTPTVPGQIAYTETVPLADVSLSGAGMINVVTQGGVDNTGGADAACAIQALLKNSALTRNDHQFGTATPMEDVIIYFPTGTYLLSNPSCLPLVKNYSDGTPAYGMVFLGQSQSGTVFKLSANTVPVVNFTGSGTPGNRLLTVSSTKGLYVNQLLKGAGMREGVSIASIGSNSITLTGSPTSTVTSTPIQALTPLILTQSATDAGVEYGNQGFNNVMENFTIDASAAGNDGAVGISYVVSNKGAVRNVTILGDSDSAMQGTGIDMTRPLIGPGLIENVSITGFNWGMDVGNTTTGLTMEHVTFDNQISGALRNDNNLVGANAIWVKSGQAASAITNVSTDGMITIANSRFDQPGASLVLNLAGGAVSIHGTNFATGQSSFNSVATNVNGVLVGSTWTADNGLFLPLTIDTPVLPYDASSQWVAPASGMSAAWTDEVGTPVDATAPINAALACRGTTSTLYLPHGVWYVSSPIQIPSWVDRIVGMDSTIRALSSSNFPAGSPIFDVTSNSSGSCPFANTLVIERLAFDNAGSNVSYSVRMDAPASGVSARTVVIRDVSNNTGVYRVSGAGELFAEDIATSPYRVDGTNYFMARQYNSEAESLCNSGSCNPRVTNNGAPAWIFGMKTEGPSNVIYSPMTTAPYAITELLSEFLNTAPGTSDATAPATNCTQAGNPVSTSSQTAAVFIVGAGPVVEANFIEDANPIATSGQTVKSQTYPFYVNNAGNCPNAGAGYYPWSPSNPYVIDGIDVIQRPTTPANGTEAGFIVPELLVKP
ncbi:Pectate lyase superfamily protein [Granulicella rosea]|uniref:Pectate lyase superfamily protein n=1 Tax=Granulicella rosea TaxID=474952 RepID=A0A239E9T0_9BACT|nr:chitobiase/beta-hexosaminidase C-terminal domain-containing protein [Granulicella rosea]SNS41239.1 Pectate lyase superfamily protein [Granulicella rosea]